MPDWANLVSSALERGNYTLSHVLLTHWHGDHTGGVPDLIRMYPNDVSDAVYKHTPGKAQKSIQDGQIFRVEGATVRAVHTPGHSEDHMCFVLEEEQAMFTGDNVLGHGSAAVEHLSTWMEALRQMQKEDCVKGYPAHGIVIQDLSTKITNELTAKMRREKQVLSTLQRIKREERQKTPANKSQVKGSVTVRQLVDAIYGDRVDHDVRKLALEPFTDEVLRKLAYDGSIGFEIREGTKKWFAVTQESCQVFGDPQ